MDYCISSLLESDQGDEISSFYALQQAEGLSGSENGSQAKSIQKRKYNASTATDHQNPQQKINHRNIERQRRQEMATLYRSLRSVLPIEYLKGKRSISDHIQETVKYIKDLEKKIQELKIKRNEIKSSRSSCVDDENLEINERDGLTVKPCLSGVEVVMDTCSKNCLPLSEVLRVLTREDLSIITCNSAKVKERMIHTIKSEAREGKSIDVSGLQQKLTNSIILPFS